MKELSVQKTFHLTGHSGAVYSISKGERSELIFSGSSDKIITRWNLATEQAENFAIQLPSIVYAICFEASLNLLLAGTSEGAIHIIDLSNKTEKKKLLHHTASIFDIVYSPVHQIFIAASADGNISVIDVVTLSLTQKIKLCNEKVRCLDLNGTQTELAIACGDGSIRIFDVAEMKEKNNFAAHQFSANAVKFHPDGIHILSGGKDAHLNIWGMREGENPILEMSIPAHNYAIYSIAFHPNNRLFATGSRDKTIKIWDSETFEFLARINKENYDGHINSVNKIYWSQYNSILVSTGDDRAIIGWEINEENQL